MEKVRKERKSSLHKIHNPFNRCAARIVHNESSIIYDTYYTMQMNMQLYTKTILGMSCNNAFRWLIERFEKNKESERPACKVIEIKQCSIQQLCAL